MPSPASPRQLPRLRQGSWWSKSYFVLTRYNLPDGIFDTTCRRLPGQDRRRRVLCATGRPRHLRRRARVSIKPPGHEKIAKLHPADIGDILNQMDPAHRCDILEGLDLETAADVLGDMDKAHRDQLLDRMDADDREDIPGTLGIPRRDCRRPDDQRVFGHIAGDDRPAND